MSAWPVAAVLAILACLPVRPAHGQGVLSQIESDVDRIAHRARPSVVTVVGQHYPLLHYRSGPVRSTRLRSRVGSGVAVGESEVLTTASVVLDAERIVVVTDNNLQVEGVLAGFDVIHNVALVRVPGLRLPPLEFATREPQLGDWVITLGSSYGAAPTQSVGNVSWFWREPRLGLLQLTNQVYPGNSGGAALNTRGELLGLVQGELGSPRLGEGDPDQDRRAGGASFVIPLDEVRDVYTQLQRDGRAHLGWLGVSTRAGWVASDTQPDLHVPLGALVESTAGGGPAERVGLRPGDLIVAFDDERVEYPEQLARWVGATPPGTAVKLVWVHDEMRHEGRVVVGESPSVVPSWIRREPALAESAATPRSPGGRSTRLPDRAMMQDSAR